MNISQGMTRQQVNDAFRKIMANLAKKERRSKSRDRKKPR